MRAALVTSLALLLLTTSTGSTESPGSLATATDLMSQPDGARVAVLLPGAVPQVIETRDGWSRVTLEGWIRAEPGLPDATPPAPAAVTPPAPAPAASSDGAIAGSVYVTDQKGRASVGSGLALRLLADPASAASEIAAIAAECDVKRDALRAEAAALKDKGDRAMKTIENPSQAFEAYDEAKRQRSAKMREAKSWDDQCGSRQEAVFDAHAAQRALTSAEGKFSFDRVPPGRYTLHAALEAAGARHEWDLDVTVAAGQRMTLDLTNANRIRFTTLPVYR